MLPLPVAPGITPDQPVLSGLIAPSPCPPAMFQPPRLTSPFERPVSYSALSTPMKMEDIESAAIHTGGKDDFDSERMQQGECMAKAQQRALERNFDLATLQATIQSMTAAMEKLQVENKALLDLVKELTLQKSAVPPEKPAKEMSRVPFLAPDARTEPCPMNSAFNDDADDVMDDDDEDLK